MFESQEVEEWTDKSLDRLNDIVSAEYIAKKKSDDALEAEKERFLRSGYVRVHGGNMYMWVNDPRQ